MPKKGFDDRLKDVKLVLETAKEALSGIGFPGVELIAGIPLLILKNYEAVGANKTAMVQLLESLEALKSIMYNPIVAKAKERGAVPEDLSTRVEQLKSKLEDLGETLTPFVSMRSWERFRERDRISTALAIVNRGVAQAIRDFQLESQIAAELQAAEAQKRSNLDLLKYANGSSWNPRRICLSGTRKDLIRELVKATTATGAYSPYRIHLVVGVAGCGKSTLAHSLSQACATSTTPTLASAFFFSRGEDGRNAPNLLFSSTAHDLSRFHPAAANAINRALENDRKILSRSLTDQFRELVRLPIASIPNSQPAVIVIDVLDEGLAGTSDEVARASEELLSILGEEFAMLSSNCRIIITSRPEPSIMQLRHKSHVCVHEIVLDDPHNQDDVSLFSQHLLSGIAKQRNLGASWPGEELQDAFIRKAEGLFIWVSTTCAFVARAANPARQLQKLCGDSSSFNLGPEAKMAQLYSTVLAACPWDDKDFADNYELLMGTILTLKTPLAPLAIKALLGMDIPITDTLRPLSPVLTGITFDVDGDRPLQIIHDSFRGYSTGRDVSTLSHNEQRYAVDEAKHSLALAVLHFLNRELPLVESTANEIIAYIMGEEGDIPSPPTGSISEPLWYSCQYLLAHSNKAAGPSPELKEALREFMNKGLSLWIVLCSSKGIFQGVSTIFARCKALSLKSPVNVNFIASLLHHLVRNLRYMGRLEEALVAAHDAVDLYTQLTREQSTESTRELAVALQNLSVSQSDLGQYADSLATIREAVEMHRSQGKDNSAESLSYALHSLSIALSNLGYHEEALAAAREAVDLHRPLARGQPDVYNPSLAYTLQTLGLCLSSLGYTEEALLGIREVVDLRRRLAKDRPATFTLDLAHALHNLSVYLSRLDHTEEAYAAIREVVDIHRQMAKDQRTLSDPGLSWSLHSQSVFLTDLGHHEEALAASYEAVDLRRQLAKGRPAVFTPDLADSLRNHSQCLSEANQHDDALAASREALELYRQLAKDRFRKFSDDLADSLEQLTERLDSVLRIDEAAEVREELRLLNEKMHNSGL